MMLLAPFLPLLPLLPLLTLLPLLYPFPSILLFVFQGELKTWKAELVRRVFPKPLLVVVPPARAFLFNLS